MFEIKVNVQLSASPELLQAIMMLVGLAGVQKVESAPTKTVTIPTNLTVENTQKQEDETPAGDGTQKGVVSTENVGKDETKEPDEVDIKKDYTEDELINFNFDTLMGMLKEHGVDPGKFEGKNTNKKLRTLVLKAQEAREAAGEAEEQNNTHDDAVMPPPEELAGPGTVTEVKLTAETLRSLMVPRIQNKDTKLAALEALKATGYASITELAEAGDDEKMSEFYNALIRIKVA